MVRGLGTEGVTHEAHVAQLNEYETSSQASGASALPAETTGIPLFAILQPVKSSTVGYW